MSAVPSDRSHIYYIDYARVLYFRRMGARCEPVQSELYTGLWAVWDYQGKITVFKSGDEITEATWLYESKQLKQSDYL